MHNVCRVDMSQLAKCPRTAVSSKEIALDIGGQTRMAVMWAPRRTWVCRD